MKPLNSKKESTKQRRRKLRNRLISVLTAAVVFATTYSLVLPAITMDAATAEAMPGVDVAPAETAPAAAEPIAAEPIAAEPVAAAPAEAAPAVEPAAEAAPAEAPAAETPTEIIADESVPMAAPEASGDALTPEPVKSESVVDDSSADSEKAAAEEKKDDAAEEQKDEEKEEEKEDEAKFAASPLTFDCAEYLVTVSFGEAAALPEGTTLGVREYAAGSMEYNAYHAILNQKLKEDGVAEEDLDEAIAALRFYEISFFNKDGVQILPLSAVDVLVEYKTPTNPVEDESLYAVTFRTDDGQPTKATLRADATSGVIAAGGVIQKLNVQGFGANDTHVNNVIGQLALNKVETEAEDAESEDSAGMFVARTVQVEGAPYGLILQYGPEAGIPEDATFRAVPLDESYADYSAYKDRALSAQSAGEGEEQVLLGLFDLTIYDAEGNVVEPLAPVTVTVDLGNALDTMNDVFAVHFVDTSVAPSAEEIAAGEVAPAETAPLEVCLAANDGGEATFSVESLSVIAVVGSGTLRKEIEHKGVKYEVTVTYGPEANIPDGSTLSVTDIDEGTAEYDYARNAVLADKKAKGEFVNIEDFNLAALDISIIDPNGIEIEPEAAVQVDIKIKELPEVEDLSEIQDTLEVQHHVEVPGGVVIETAFDGAAEGAFKMATDEEIASSGIVVDPNSVSDEDFVLEAQKENVIDISFDTEVFSTFTVTWNNGRATVHYGYMNGNNFVEFPTGTPAYTPTFNSNYAFLIYDVEGYEYDSTHLNSATGTAIRPILNVAGNNHQYTTSTADNPNNPWTSFNNGSNIYVVYKAKKNPTPGGTPEIDEDEEWPEGDNAPQFSKSSVNHGDGTNIISLSIAAGEKPVEKTTPADVIVIFDNSGSMRTNDMSGTRLAAAQTATNTMANTLLNGQNHDVRMALISFSNTAQVEQAFTNNYTTFRNKVNDLAADGGTNWEKALQLANEMEVREDAATFVVFVTDGDPTFRQSRGNVSDGDMDIYNSYTYRYFRQYGVYGDGQHDDQGRNLNFAVDQVSAINTAGKNFYAIGISNDVTKVRNLTTQGGVAADHAFIASDKAAMDAAFKSITESIKSALGFGDVEITDGITELSHTEMKVMQSVDPDSFKYYRWGGEGNKYGADEAHMTEWTTREADGCGPATYTESDGAVHWDMGEGFQLEDGVHYVVTFRVWPSQEAYDLVAQLNNGEKVYAEGQPNSITAEERAQVVELSAPTETTQGSYALKTNTDTVNATYSQTSKTGDKVVVSGEQDLEASYHEGTIQNMALESMQLTVKKVFEDDLTGGEDREPLITLLLKRRSAHQDPEAEFENYPVPQAGGTSPYIKLGKETLPDGTVMDYGWEYSLYVAPGFEVDGEVLEHGYDFTLAEPDIDYHYGLVEEIINPMVVNGVDKYYGDGVLIEDDETIDEYIDRSLTAVNRVKSGIDIEKHVFDVDGTTEIFPETEFEITGYILDAEGNPYTFDQAWDTRTDKSSQTWEPASASAHQNDTGAYHKYDKDGNRIIYKGHFDSTGAISFTLKAGERVRFINVPDGCTFQFTETVAGMDALGYQFVNTVAITQHKTSPDGPFTPEGDVQPVVSGPTATLETGVVGNKQYAVTYNNKRTIPLPDVELIKVDKDDNTLKLNGAEFALHKDAIDGELVTVDGNGKDIAITTGNKEGSTGPDGWYHIGVLPAGTYYLVETKEPDSYVLDETPVIITVTKGTSSYTVTATKNGKSVITGPTDGRYTITVDNELNLTEAEAKKEWKNADGTTTAPDGATVVFTLYADGEETEYAVTLNGAADESVPTTAGGYESEGWTAKFVNLPKYSKTDEGLKLIEYTIGETTTYPGYTKSPETPVASGGTITNTQEPTEANALKAWKNADGSTTPPDGATVVFTLYADGTATKYTVTLDGTVDTAPTVTGGYESEAWKAMFINLPKYQTGTTIAIKYTIAETTTYPGYTASTTDPVASGETITNEQGSTGTFAEKVWKNADGSTTPPEGGTVVFTLYADGTATNYTVTLDGTVDTAPTGTGGYESEAWKAEYVNLPKYKAGTTTEIIYTIAETTGYPGYTADTTDPVPSGSKITNSQDPTSANALKAWKNADGTTTAPQGGKVIYTLYADGTATTYTVTLDGTADTKPEVTGGYESEAWKAEFVYLPKYKVGTTTEIVYTIKETGTYPGYTPSTTDAVASGETIKNEQEPTTANARKEWKNADGTTEPPEGATVEFTLYSDGTATDYKVTLNGEVDEAPEGAGGYENPAWTATFINLPKYKIVEGEAVEIEYTIDETVTYPGYAESPEGPVESGETITNTQEAIDVNAKKVWENADGTDTPPEDATVEFTLLAGGKATDYKVTLDGTADSEPTGTAGYESPAWTATFINLPKYEVVNGETSEIEYTIDETITYPNYEKLPEDPVGSGETITNKQQTQWVRFKKINMESEALSGAVFTFNDGKSDITITSGADGIMATEATDTEASVNEFQLAVRDDAYVLTETTAPGGYLKLTEDVNVNVYVNNVKARIGDSTECSVSGSGTKDDPYLVTIINSDGKELPHTGGTGTLPFTLGGIGLILASALMYVFRMRRRERRVF